MPFDPKTEGFWRQYCRMWRESFADDLRIRYIARFAILFIHTAWLLAVAAGTLTGIWLARLCR